jgi:acetyl esterase/lipase
VQISEETAMPTIIGRLEPALLEALQNAPKRTDFADIPGSRARLAEFFADATAGLAPVEGVEVTARVVPGIGTAPDVAVEIYRPEGAASELPILLWMHGGGMVVGNVEMDRRANMTRAKDVGCVVVSVEYRLAPEHPYPAAIQDCHAALRWIAANAADLGCDGTRIAVGGNSSGAGLAAGLSLLARDSADVPISFLMLVYPMLDHRSTTRSSEWIIDPIVWNRASNVAAWRAYLGELADDAVPPYASPAIAEDLTNLPPTCIMVGDLDLFVDEDVEYARRLMSAGVPTELHVYSGAFHGVDVLAPSHALGVRWRRDFVSAVRRGLQLKA